MCKIFKYVLLKVKKYTTTDNLKLTKKIKHHTSKLIADDESLIKYLTREDITYILAGIIYIAY